LVSGRGGSTQVLHFLAKFVALPPHPANLLPGPARFSHYTGSKLGGAAHRFAVLPVGSGELSDIPPKLSHLGLHLTLNAPLGFLAPRPPESGILTRFLQLRGEVGGLGLRVVLPIQLPACHYGFAGGVRRNSANPLHDLYPLGDGAFCPLILLFNSVEEFQIARQLGACALKAHTGCYGDPAEDLIILFGCFAQPWVRSGPGAGRLHKVQHGPMDTSGGLGGLQVRLYKGLGGDGDVGGGHVKLLRNLRQVLEGCRHRGGFQIQYLV